MNSTQQIHWASSLTRWPTRNGFAPGTAPGYLPKTKKATASISVLPSLRQRDLWIWAHCLRDNRFSLTVAPVSTADLKYEDFLGFPVNHWYIRFRITFLLVGGEVGRLEWTNSSDGFENTDHQTPLTGPVSQLIPGSSEYPAFRIRGRDLAINSYRLLAQEANVAPIRMNIVCDTINFETTEVFDERYAATTVEDNSNDYMTGLQCLSQYP